jgi:diguanylate cyclase (GGDEF)-like protein
MQVELSAAGYEVSLAPDGIAGLQAAVESQPDLALVDVMMPGMDGFELTRRLREDARTEGMSIILVTARGLMTDKLTGLAAGADDYIVKPFDNDELLARVRTTLRRARYMRAQSPLTGLPGNVRIEDEIRARVDSEEPFALMYLDLDNFKAYSDRYGFVRGDEVLRSTGHLIRDAAKGIGGTQTFVGHIGGDDYVVVTTPELALPIAEAVIVRFDAAVPSFYDEEDRARGYLEGQSRLGELHRFPLLSISIGIATTERRALKHRAEVVAVATELKNLAKRTAGSTWAIDRRSSP